MKISLLLIGLVLVFFNANAQTGMKNGYSPTIIIKKKKAGHLGGASTFYSIRPDTIFREGRPIFWQYLPKRKNYVAPFPIDGLLATRNLNNNPIDTQIDLERTRNRTKLLFFKMKMWGYFKY